MLEALRVFFGCGRVRTKGSGSAVHVFAVDRMADLEGRVVPFFENHPAASSAAAPSRKSLRDPQRLHARPHPKWWVKIQSELHGDMQSQAEMT